MDHYTNLPTHPYFRTPAELPAPLPTTADIENETDEIRTNYHPDCRRIVVIGKQFVAKFGSKVKENEGYALLFLEKMCPSFPVPRLHAMYKAGERLYIVMDYKPGTNLLTLWPTLNQEEKMSIAKQLRKKMDQIRSIASPGIFSDVTGGPLKHRWFFWWPDPRISGPFQTEEDFNKGLVLRMQKTWEDNSTQGWLAEFFARHLPGTLQGHPSVFTHSDFHRGNVLVKETNENPPGARQFEVTAIIDWESAGWYPSYWEYARCFMDFNWADDWLEMVEHIIKPYPSEAAFLKLIRMDIEF
ncbi:kinase-like protein [Xylaria sp. FL1777]|nr:kinase-like protein [Xylaria sp. FL1777]